MYSLLFLMSLIVKHLEKLYRSLSYCETVYESIWFSEGFRTFTALFNLVWWLTNVSYPQTDIALKNKRIFVLGHYSGFTWLQRPSSRPESCCLETFSLAAKHYDMWQWTNNVMSDDWIPFAVAVTMSTCCQSESCGWKQESNTSPADKETVCAWHMYQLNLPAYRLNHYLSKSEAECVSHWHQRTSSLPLAFWGAWCVFIWRIGMRTCWKVFWLGKKGKSDVPWCCNWFL